MLLNSEPSEVDNGLSIQAERREDEGEVWYF